MEPGQSSLVGVPPLDDELELVLELLADDALLLDEDELALLLEEELAPEELDALELLLDALELLLVLEIPFDDALESGAL